MGDNKQSLFRTVISMMISPASALKGAMGSVPWFFSVAVSAAAFGLFFLQTGLDLYKTGQKGADYIVLSTGSGALYGLVVIPVLGGLIWLILKAAKTEKSLKWAVSSLCLSYSGALVYGLTGIAFSLLLGWKTAIAFGVTGVLWAIGPMILAIREMSEGKNGLSIPIATVVSAIVLISWSIYGNI